MRALGVSKVAKCALNSHNVCKQRNAFESDAPTSVTSLKMSGDQQGPGAARRPRVHGQERESSRGVEAGALECAPTKKARYV